MCCDEPEDEEAAWCAPGKPIDSIAGRSTESRKRQVHSSG